MKTNVKKLLFEAYRRNDMADKQERNQPLSMRWLGLGTEAAYRQGINAGLFVFHDGRAPSARCMGWLCLTEKGIREMKENSEEFKRVLDKLKQGDYSRSYASQYMMAGGITS